MKRIIITCCFLYACMSNAYADRLIKLNCGASFREIPHNQCFEGTRTKTIAGVTYSYSIYKTWIGGSGLFEISDKQILGDKPIGLRIERVEFPGTMENINVPLTIENIPVIAIGYGCFQRCSRLKSVAIPKTVISIEGAVGGGAFEDCISLETIVLPPRLVNIGYRAFKGCCKLKTKFEFNNDIDLGSEAFYGCREITSIRFKKGINSYQAPHRTLRTDFNEIGPGTFADCRKLNDFEIPSSIRRVGTSTSGTPGAFSNCCSLVKVTLPKGLEELGCYAFADCTSLTEVAIPSRIERMGYRVFSGCTALKTVKLPETLEKLPSSTFAGCTSLETIYLPNGIVEFEDSVFYGCTNLKDISIPDHVSEIGVSCFEGCSSLQTVKLPLHLDVIKPCAFRGCSSLEALQLPPAITTICGQAFEGCAKMTSINIPDSVGKMGKHLVGSIGQHAFRGCDALKYLKLPDGCSCYPTTFEGLRGLEEVDIPASLEASQSAEVYGEPYKYYSFDFENYFKDSTNIVKVTVRNMINPRCAGGLKIIGGFKGLTKLKTVKLPEGLEEIEARAFEDCISLSEITLPASVKNISYNAFAGCLSLKNINLPDGVKIATGAFKGCPAYIDPKEEEEKRARVAAETAAREKVAKEAAERLEYERKVKKDAEEIAAKAERERKKFEEEESKRETENAQRVKRLEELNERLSKMHNDVSNKINDAQSGGTGFIILPFLVIVGVAAGIFAYAKKKSYTFLDGAREIAEKITTVFSVIVDNIKQKWCERTNGEQELEETGAMMDILEKNYFACPHCGQHFESDPDIAGMEADCPTCGRSFIVPMKKDK